MAKKTKFRIYIHGIQYVYSFAAPGSTKFSVEAEFTEKELIFLDKAFSEFTKAQDLLKKKYDDKVLSNVTKKEKKS